LWFSLDKNLSPQIGLKAGHAGPDPVSDKHPSMALKNKVSQRSGHNRASKQIPS
jgi:hypothetical protein